MKHLTLIACLSTACALSAQNWTQLATPPLPSPTSARRAGGAAYDLMNARALFYGGLQSSPTLTLNETWAFDGTTWTQLTPATTPPPRWGHRMVLDTRRMRVVAFGGRSPTTTANANDTWEWTGSDWVQVVTATAPSARAFYSMVFDERRGVTVLYGTMGGFPNGDQTWEYDGTNWTQRTTATTPPGLETPAMAYDKGRGVTVMFGGWYGVSPGMMHNTTWEYDGIDWVQRTTNTTPPARYRAGCVYDSARGRVVMFGGYGTGALTDTWEYDGNDWTQVLSGVGPTAITEGYMVYDEVRGQSYHFGGSGPGSTPNQTWGYTGPTTAHAAPFGRGCPGSVGTPAMSALNTPVLGTLYQIQVTNLPNAAGITLIGHGLSNRVSIAGNLPFDLTPLGLPGCRLETSAEVQTYTAISNGVASQTHFIPNVPALIGMHVWSQAFTMDPVAANAVGSMSTGLRTVLGT